VGTVAIVDVPLATEQQAISILDQLVSAITALRQPEAAPVASAKTSR